MGEERRRSGVMDEDRVRRYSWQFCEVLARGGAYDQDGRSTYATEEVSDKNH